MRNASEILLEFLLFGNRFLFDFFSIFQKFKNRSEIARDVHYMQKYVQFKCFPESYALPPGGLALAGRPALVLFFYFAGKRYFFYFADHFGEFAKSDFFLIFLVFAGKRGI